MLSQLRPALVLVVAMTLLTGLAYPLAVTGIARAIFPWQAGGSLIERDGRVIGSALIGQSFTTDRYFHGRPSAAGTGYDAASSGGSNQGPTSRALIDRIKADVARLRAAGIGGPIPADLVTSSASGLDPDISPASALLQAPLVARARGLPPMLVLDLVRGHIEGPDLGFLGEPRVNVLALNLDLDRLSAGRGGG
jgi:K+-transporting ATPase ATPase C chain